ncbi:MAG: serine hydrolase [Methanomicrobiales archaeon]
MENKFNVVIYSTILLILIISSIGYSFSIETTSESFSQSSSDNRAINSANVEEFMDKLISGQLDKNNIVGATVVVVKDGKIIFNKGYGYSNPINKQPVIANQTLFHVGSISKLFVWTSVMQLVQEGKIDLDADVNTYLTDFKVPNTYPGQPITMRHLMTHTAGFEDTKRSMAVQSPDEIQPLGEFLKKNLPARVRPPGETISYSNHGTALAAHIVEEVSGESYDDYLEKNIFIPLKMSSTTIKQPAPANLDSRTAKSYYYQDGNYVAKESYINMAAAGAIKATSTDIGNFMIAHLQNGVYEDNRILNEATSKEMLKKQFTVDPTNSMCLGFMQHQWNNKTVLGHPGDLDTFANYMLLIPDDNTGVFISYNGEGATTSRIEFIVSFMDYFYPPSDENTLTTKTITNSSDMFSGTYRITMSPYTTIEKYISQSTIYYDVKFNKNGSLYITDGSGQITEFVQSDQPLKFKFVNGTNDLRGDIYFKTNHDGQMTSFSGGNVYITVYEKVSWYQDPSLANILFYICIIVFATVLIWPIMWLREKRKNENISPTKIAQYAHWLAGIAVILNISFLAGLYYFIYYSDLVLAFYSLFQVPVTVILLFTIPVIATLFTVGTLISTIFVWKNKYWDLKNRVHYTLVLASLVIFIWWLNFWNLLGYNF